MPFCENEGCGKTSLTKEQVDIDEATNKVICLDCHHKKYGVRKVVPVSLDKDQLSWGVHLTSDKGFQAEVGVGDVKLQLNASTEQLKEILGS